MDRRVESELDSVTLQKFDLCRFLSRRLSRRSWSRKPFSLSLYIYTFHLDKWRRDGAGYLIAKGLKKGWIISREKRNSSFVSSLPVNLPATCARRRFKVYVGAVSSAIDGSREEEEGRKRPILSSLINQPPPSPSDLLAIGQVSFVETRDVSSSFFHFIFLTQ